jgi:hypothetical protein
MCAGHDEKRGQQGGKGSYQHAAEAKRGASVEGRPAAPRARPGARAHARQA